MYNPFAGLFGEVAGPENLGFAGSLLAAVVPRFRPGPRPEGELPTGSAMVDQSATVLLETDAAGIVRQITPNSRQILGDACERAAEFNLALSEVLQPDSEGEIEKLLQRVLVSTGEIITAEVLTRAPSGAPRWLEMWCRTHVASAGGGFRFEIRDVTLQRTDHSVRNLLASVLHRVPESVMLTDTSGVIQYVNPAFETLTGHRTTDVLGKTPALLKSGKHPQDFYEKLWSTLASGRAFRTEIVNRRKNGELYQEDLVITPVTDLTGTVMHYVSTARDITEQKKNESQIEERAYFDTLTGVSNPRLLRERSRQILALARRHGHTAALLHLDIKGLRSINEGHGRNVGDEVLRRVADRLRQGLRESDTMARLGSDEFLVLLSEVAEEDATARVVRRLRDSICKPFKIQDHTVSLNTSIGVALYPSDATTYDELVEYSELALNRARTAGTGVEFFRTELTNLTNERLSLEDDLRWAWERKQFVLHYQPIVALDTGTMIGAEALTRGSMIGIEALARWPHLERGMIEPSQFIPLAERTGRIIALDRWAISTACKQAAQWAANGWPGWVSVNMSARSLHDGDLATYITSCMEQHNVEPGRLVLEVTESSAMRDVEVTARILRQLRDAGVLIALDDFGIGHSSLAYLKYFPVDFLKLDQSFVQDIGSDPKYEQLIEVIITLAHRIGAKIIAEGVEDADQLEWLRAAGCDYVQGYLVGRPQPPEFVKPLELYKGPDAAPQV